MSALRTFCEDPSPANAVALAISDHYGTNPQGGFDGQYIDSLIRAKTIVETDRALAKAIIQYCRDRGSCYPSDLGPILTLARQAAL